MTTPSERYQAKLEAKRDRLKDRAEQARATAAGAQRRYDTIASVIPLGQPILVGHHSERRHRKDLVRMDSAIRTTIEASKQAQALEHRAATYGTHAISSDDPDAPDKLRAKLEKLERDQTRMKATNAAFKKGGWAKVAADGLQSEALCMTMAETMARSSWVKAPFEPFELSNNLANIRRIKARIETLECHAQTPERAFNSNAGWSASVDREDNRVRIVFGQKPDEGIRHELKSSGFRWSPTASAWQRQDGPGVFELAKRLMTRLMPAKEI